MHRMFGRSLVDYSVASGAGLLNLKTLDYEESFLKALGIGTDRLSALAEFDGFLQGMERKVAQELNLSPDIPWIVGTGDGSASNLGLGAMSLAAPSTMGGWPGTGRFEFWDWMPPLRPN